MDNPYARSTPFCGNRGANDVKFFSILYLLIDETYVKYKYYVSGHYPSSCLYLKTQTFGDWILSASSGKTYSVGPN
jgi:hypothetical protein